MKTRSALPLALAALLLAACAAPPSNEGKVLPPASFKVNPGLMGQSVPAELQPAGQDVPPKENVQVTPIAPVNVTQ